LSNIRTTRPALLYFYKKITMNTILAATDFSPAARNAARYAALLAKKTRSKLILLNVCHPPVLISEGAIVTYSIEEIKANAAKKLRYAVSGLKRMVPGLDAQALAVLGLAADEIERIVKEKKISLLVMGIENSNAFSERLFGSTVTSLMLRSSCPILTVKKTMKFAPLKNILLAADYTEYWPWLPATLLDLAKVNRATFHILHISPSADQSPGAVQTIAAREFHDLLQGIRHRFERVVSADIVNAIRKYAATHDIDLVVMNPHKHTFAEKLFSPSKSEQMAFHSELPLLTYC
jgi:nucleotide-binding universal stress UspA family protein